MISALDNPIWNALSSRQSHLGLRRGDAARYRPGVSILAGLATPSREALRDLAALCQPGELLAVFGLEEIEDVGPDWQVQDAMPIAQLVCGAELSPPAIESLPLGPADVDDMLGLVELTQPGPFGPNTIQMGRYVGVREQGRLIAMAGERLAPPGHTEVSGVCTHPDRTGRGLGEALVREVGSAIQARGETAFLHVLAGNTRAIALYARLGFRLRRTRNLTPIVRV